MLSLKTYFETPPAGRPGRPGWSGHVLDHAGGGVRGGEAAASRASGRDPAPALRTVVYGLVVWGFIETRLALSTY